VANEHPAAQTYDCPDCGSSLPDEIGVQECECGRVVETYATEGEIPEEVERV